MSDSRSQHSALSTQHSPSAIRTENLTKVFGANTAVDGLTLTVAEGEIFGLVGPDGAGKTTTMRLLTGILEPTSGEAWVAGLHVGRDAEPIKEHIGYMSQRFGLYSGSDGDGEHRLLRRHLRRAAGRAAASGSTGCWPSAT